jgi:hypothetical protein
LRIDILSGSYRATFDLMDTSAAVPPAPVDDVHVSELSAQPEPLKIVSGDGEPAGRSGGHRRVALWTGAVAIALICACVLALWLPRKFENPDERAFREFWAPLVDSRRPVVIYIGASYSYRLTTRFLD